MLLTAKPNRTSLEEAELSLLPSKLARLETRYKTLVTALAPTQGIFYLKDLYLVSVNPAQVLKDLLGFDRHSSEVNFSRPSITMDSSPTEDITYIVPLMKFVCREEPAKLVYNVLDEYLDWKANMTGEPEKNIKFITVVGTSGKGKTTFSRRFMNLPYSGRHPDLVNDCRECNRRYRISCTELNITSDPETQLSLLVLYEAFKHCSSDVLLQDFISEFYCNFSGKLRFADILEIITKTFFTESSDKNHRKLLIIINLDETNSLLNSFKHKEFFQELLRILRNASKRFNLLTVLSGTQPVDLFEQVKISQCKFVDIKLSLIELEASKEVILGMTKNPDSYHVSPHLEYLLTLCGGVGRYIEIAIIQMSIIGSAKSDGKEIKGFNLNSYKYFLENLQTPTHIDILLERLTTGVLSHYPEVFSRFSQSIELLSCYTLFQWPVQRETAINLSSIDSLEKEGLVFLQPMATFSSSFICIIPFITLFWAIKYSNQTVQIPFVKDSKSYFSPDESENNSLHIVMAKLWGLVHKNKLSTDKDGLYSISLSELFPLRDSQRDSKIRFRPLFQINSSPQRIDKYNYIELISDYECMAFLNAKGASFPDAVIFSNPIIGIQEKQSIVAKKRRLAGSPASYVDNASYQIEREKFLQNQIFVLVTDEEIGDFKLGPLDVVIDCENFAEFCGPLIALRKLYSINALNENAKRLKLK